MNIKKIHFVKVQRADIVQYYAVMANGRHKAASKATSMFYSQFFPNNIVPGFHMLTSTTI